MALSQSFFIIEIILNTYYPKLNEMKRLALLAVLIGLSIFLSFSQAPTKLWSTPYEINYFVAKETGFSSDSRYFAIGDEKGKVTLYESASGQIYDTYAHQKGKIFCSIFQPKGTIVASSDKNGTIALYDYQAKKLITLIQAHEDAIPALCFDRTGTKIYSGSRDNSIKVWSVPEGKLESVITGINGNVLSIRITDDNTTLVIGTSAISKGLTFIDLNSDTKSVKESANVQKLDVSPDGRYVATANLVKYISLWEVNAGILKSKLEGHDKNVNCVVFSPDSKQLISGSNDKSIKIWNMEGQNILYNIEGEKNIVGLALSPNGKFLAVMDEKPLLSIWDVSMAIDGPVVSSVSKEPEQQAQVMNTPSPVATATVGVEKVQGVSAPVNTTVATVPRPEVKSSAAPVMRTDKPAVKMNTASTLKVKDVDGNEYNVVKIGSQLWMKENLNVRKFQDGEEIKEATSLKEWDDAYYKKEPAWCYYNFDPANGKRYGKYYNYYAITDYRKIAPKGWHIPDSDEWVELDNTLGGSAKAGIRLRSDKASEWKSLQQPDTVSGFDALSTGNVYSVVGELFHDFGSSTAWWSSHGKDEYMHKAHFIYKEGRAVMDDTYKGVGLPIRCVAGDAVDSWNTVVCQNNTWMSKNLSTKTFNNGDPIPEAQTAQEWAEAAREQKPAWCSVPEFEGDGAYGVLYNSYAIEDPRGLAPAGWRIADLSDWIQLFSGYYVDIPDSMIVMEMVKEKPGRHWDLEKTNAFYAKHPFSNQFLNLLDFIEVKEESRQRQYSYYSNMSGLSAVPGGKRLSNGSFKEQGQSCYIWSNYKFSVGSPLGSFVLMSILDPVTGLNLPQGKKIGFINDTNDKGQGFSVRCIKNSTFVIAKP